MAPDRAGMRRALAAGALWAGALAINRSLRVVEGQSMLPTLAPGDRVLVRPLVPALAGGVPNRGDLAVVRLNGRSTIKRVVGLPGDVVVLGDGHLHVDGAWWRVRGEVVDEDWRLEAGIDQVVVLGDNRRRSTDSRHLGAVPLADVTHVVVAGVTPAQRLGADVGMRRLDGPRRRDAVRVIVLDPDDRTLLFRVKDVDGGPQQWWETPGGGMRPGETPMGTALREVAEEVGTPHGPVVDLDHVITRETSYRGTQVARVERTMATRLERAEVSTTGWTASEQRDHVGWEWCTRHDLAALAEPIVPADLEPLLDRALAALPPREP